MEEINAQPLVRIVSEKFEDNFQNLMPFFSKYYLIGNKRLDFLSWCEVAKLMNTKSHLTSEGIAVITSIKEKMNRGREEEADPPHYYGKILQSSISKYSRSNDLLPLYARSNNCYNKCYNNCWVAKRKYATNIKNLEGQVATINYGD